MGVCDSVQLDPLVTAKLLFYFYTLFGHFFILVNKNVDTD